MPAQRVIADFKIYNKKKKTQMSLLLKPTFTPIETFHYLERLYDTLVSIYHTH